MADHLVAVLLFVADDLDERGYQYAGAVRQGARRITELETLDNRGAPKACPTCGVEVIQPARGRRRVFCSAQCRHRARNGREIVESQQQTS